MAGAMSEFEPLLSGLCFPEAPRWRGGRLFFSDMHAHWVMSVDEAGESERIVEIEQQPSGIGWRPDGTMLIVSMIDRKVVALKDGELRTVADLSHLATWHCNDMVVDRKGRAYVGNFGFDLHAPGVELTPDVMPTLRKADLVLIDVNDQARVVASELAFPNGTIITPDGGTLIVAETMVGRLTAFDIAADGSLHNRRTWAQLENVSPDGICLDAAGGIWVASPFSNECLRVEEGGSVTHRITTDQGCFACMLGGADGRTLFACTALEFEPARARELLAGRIERAPAPYARAGLP
jgi:sugar lactone lactonase YvrE